MRDVTEEQGVVEEIEFLARSANRIQLLAAIQDEGTIEKRTLQNQFDVARTTLVRNLETLEERGWIETGNPNTYTLTCAGEVVTDSFADLMDVVRITKRLRPFLKWLPTDTFNLDLRLLTDAEIILADSSDPYATTNRHVEALKRTQTFRAILPVVGQHSVETAWRRIREGKGEHEVVVRPEIAELLRTDPSYARQIEKGLDTERIEMFVYDGDIPYFIGLYDELVQIGVEDDDGMPRAMVETNAKDVRIWAEQTYEDYRRQAELLTVPGNQNED